MDAIIGGAAEYNLAAREGNWHSLCDATLRFNHPDLIRLLALWRSEAGDKPVPLRSTMSPRLLKSFLRDIALYERIKGDDGRRRYRVRLIDACRHGDDPLGNLGGQTVVSCQFGGGVACRRRTPAVESAGE